MKKLGIVLILLFSIAFAATLGVQAVSVEWAGEQILVDSTEGYDTSSVYYLTNAESLVVYAKVYDGADGNDSVAAILYDVSPISGKLTVISEIDTFASDGEVRKVVSMIPGYWGVAVVVQRIGTADPGDSIEIQLLPINRAE